MPIPNAAIGAIESSAVRGTVSGTGLLNGLQSTGQDCCVSLPAHRVSPQKVSDSQFRFSIGVSKKVPHNDSSTQSLDWTPSLHAPQSEQTHFSAQPAPCAKTIAQNTAKKNASNKKISLWEDKFPPILNGFSPILIIRLQCWKKWALPQNQQIKSCKKKAKKSSQSTKILFAPNCLKALQTPFRYAKANIKRNF